MPAVVLTHRGVSVALKFDFGALARWPKEWTVSVRRPAPYRGPLFGLFDPGVDLRKEGVEGFPAELVLPAYSKNQAEFTCELEDEWEVAMLLRLVFYEA